MSDGTRRYFGCKPIILDEKASARFHEVMKRSPKRLFVKNKTISKVYKRNERNLNYE